METSTEPPAGVADREMFNVLYNRNMFVPLEKIFPNLAVDFSYLELWKPYFELNWNGGRCQPETVFGSLGFLFGLQKYNFAYDISAPVLVTINDPAALDAKGFTFQFFVEANMRNNECLKTNYAPLQFPFAPGASMFSDIDKRVPYNTTVIAMNSQTNKPVEAAAVSFSCGDASALLGETNASGVFIGKFPGCFDGVVTVQTEDAVPAYKQLTTLYDEPVSGPIVAVLEPYRTVNFEVKKHVIAKTPDYAELFNPLTNSSFSTQTGWSWKLEPDKETAKPLESGDHAVITMTRKGAEGEDEFNIFADIDPDANPANDLSKDIKIVPGKYTVRIDLFKTPENDIIIPPQSDFIFKKKLGKVIAREDWCVPNEKIVLRKGNETYAGSAEIDDFEVKQSIKSGDTLVFYAPYLDLESVTDKCYIVSRKGEGYAIGENPIDGNYPGAPWGCGLGRTRTVCERIIDDLSEMENFADRVAANPKEFSPDVVSG